MKKLIDKYHKILLNEASTENLGSSIMLLKEVLSLTHIADDNDISNETNELLLSLKKVPEFIYNNPDKIDDNNYSFILDISNLVFHNAYFALLPKISKKSKKYFSLIEIFLNFSKYMDKASDQYYIKALCYEAIGKYNLAINFYNESLLATHPDDHDYITILQNYWATLVEYKQFDEAFQLLLDYQFKILPKDFPEYQNLLWASFKMRKVSI